MSASPALLAVRDAITIVDERPALLSVELPITTVSEANRRDKWAGVNRAKTHRAAAAMAVRHASQQQRSQHATETLGTVHSGSSPAVVVVLTRVAPRALDSDNLARSLKACRDGVADALGIDDRDPRVTWLCDQRKGTASVTVEIYRRGP